VAEANSKMRNESSTVPIDTDGFVFTPFDSTVLQLPCERDSLMVALSDEFAMMTSLDDELEEDIHLGAAPLKDPARPENGKPPNVRDENIDRTDFLLTITDETKLRDHGLKTTPAENRENAPQRGNGKTTTQWNVEPADPFEGGLAAFCEKDYLKAATKLEISLGLRADRLAAAQETATKRMGQLADAAFFLGAALFEQGKYQESAQAYERCLQIRTQDTVALNNKAQSLADAGDLAGATQLYRRVLEIFETTLGPSDSKLAIAFENLGRSLEINGDFAGAEPLYRRALSIDENLLQSYHPRISISLKNLAALLVSKGDFAEARELFRKAFVIDEIGSQSH